MTRSLTFTAAALAAVLLAALAVEAQEAAPDASSPFADPAAAADRIAAQADAAAAQAEAAAEQVAAQAEAVAERAAEAAHRAVEEAEVRFQHSADVAIDANSGEVVVGGDPFAGPRRMVYARGGKFERRAADPETIKMLDLDRKLSKQVSELAAKYKSLSDDEERGAVEQELMARVNDQFTVRQALREKELAELEEQVKHLRDLHEKRNGQKDRIVGDRVQQLLREAQGLGWGDAGGAGNEFGGAAGFGGATGGGGGFNFGGDRKFDLQFKTTEPVKIKPRIEGAVEKARRLILSSEGETLEVQPLAGEPVAPTPKKK
jgi:hypothetical protein